MKMNLIVLFILAVICISAQCLLADAPKNIGVSFNGRNGDITEPLAYEKWHTIVAKYTYPGKIDQLTNTYLVICSGSSKLSGFYIGYNLPRNELAIVKHGFWNATEAIGAPGDSNKIIENDQGYLDCTNTKVERTADNITVTYRVKFKKNILKGNLNVFMYIEDKETNYDGFTNMSTIVIGNDGTTLRSDMPKQWKNTLKPAGKASPLLSLAINGKTSYSIVTPKNATTVEKKAASDIATYFKLISGAVFPVISENKLAANKRYISIGRTQLLAKSRSAWKNTDLANEGYAIDVTKKNIYLYGGKTRGLMNAVYSLLEEDLGCRWYSTTSIDTPKMKKFEVSLVPRKYLPVLELRDPYIYKIHDAKWSLENKTNTPHARIPMEWGGSIRYYHMGHTYAAYFPEKQYFAEHPEYYALVNGKRQTSQLCHTNEDVIRLSIEKACEIFRNNPDVTITAIGPNDGRGFCDCPDCTKLNEENGGRSGSYFYFLNRIAEGVKKEFPNNHIISLAYLDYAKPPTNIKVDPYIIIQLCSDSHAWKYQFCNVWESTDYQNMLKAWHAVNAKIYLWDYTTDYVHYLVPMANWQVVAGNTRFNIKNGVNGIMYESEANDNDEMRGWVWAKQLWNPALDTKSLLHDFIYGYYKESADPMWNYEMMMWNFWEKWHKVPHKCGEASDNPLLNNLQCSYAPDGPMFTPEYMSNMRKYFTEAEKLAKSDEILSRVKKAKISLLYLELAQNLGYYTEFGDFVYGRSIRKSPADKVIYKHYLDEFSDLVKKNELSYFGIPNTFDKLYTKWSSCIATDSSSLPKLDLPAEWIFTTDPDDKGISEKWYANQKYFDAAVRNPNEFGGGEASITPLAKGLYRLHINRGIGWEQQGFPGFEGYGWYFQNIEIPEDMMNKKHLYLYFLGVNEQAWIYINGEFAFERTYASTGKSVGDLAGAPFSCDIKNFAKPGVRNTVAVRVTHSSGLGGIWLPAMLFGTDEECTTQQLDKYRF